MGHIVRTFLRLMLSEFIKLRHSALLRVVWLFPLLYLVIEFLIFERPAVGLRTMSVKFSNVWDVGQVKMVGSLWAGFFHPLMLALLPALIFRPEHRHKVWGHLHSMPVSRRGIFLSKAVMGMLLNAVMLLLVFVGHFVERGAIARINPLLGSPFHGIAMLKILGWLWLGSLPILLFYLWVSDRINSLAVSIVFGLIGLILTISLSGADMTQAQAWRRDLIPWVLPYICAQQANDSNARQELHAAGTAFKLDDSHPPDEFVIKLPSGRKARIHGGPPWDVIFPPPKPTPQWILALFSAGAGMVILGLGLLDAGRNRI